MPYMIKYQRASKINKLILYSCVSRSQMVNERWFVHLFSFYFKSIDAWCSTHSRVIKNNVGCKWLIFRMVGTQMVNTFGSRSTFVCVFIWLLTRDSWWTGNRRADRGDDNVLKYSLTQKRGVALLLLGFYGAFTSG